MSTSKNYQLVCGMEIHAELKTASKMFCGCTNDPFHAPEPNCYTCPVCLGLPGALPVANRKAIEWTIKLGLALGCKINLYSKFDRKHYFYPDLPKGYQISQYDIPFCYDGVLETSMGPVKITRIHLEEDTGKLLHKTIDGEKVSLIDFNRSSVPLVEIVSEPDIHTSQQAKEYAKKMREILRALDIADCDMEQGGMRLEANTSLQESGAKELPAYKVEVKNINSFRFLEQAISFEIARQTEILSDGKVPTQETRGFNPDSGETFPQRSKESAEDYRYFPDPDLPPLRFTPEQIEQWRSELPELPAQRAKRWSTSYAIEARFADSLSADQEKVLVLDAIFDQAKARSLDVNKLSAAIANKRLELPATVSDVAVLLETYASSLTTTELDTTAITPIIQNVLKANPDVVAKYKAGQQQVIGFLMGQVMRELSTKPNPKELQSLIVAQLQQAE